MPKISFIACLEVPYKFVCGGGVEVVGWGSAGFHLIVGHTNFVLGGSWAVTITWEVVGIKNAIIRLRKVALFFCVWSSSIYKNIEVIFHLNEIEVNINLKIIEVVLNLKNNSPFDKIEVIFYIFFFIFI